jgi:outer membrane receptor protein involved in Fe transport
MIQKSKRISKLVSSTAITSVLTLGWASNAYAQDAADTDEVIEEIVISGTAGGKGISRQDASFAVTTINSDEINKIGAVSTADLYKNIPGVWAESSGGVSGANIDVRGLPGGGDAPFVTTSLNGSPLFGFDTLSFFETSTIFRADETIASVEGLRGGPNSVFGKGEPGLTVNFRLKEGGEETEGRLKYTTGLGFNEQRVDAFLSGKIDDGLYYAIGGYVRGGSGVRDTQFNSEEGYQFSAQITKELERGKINVYSRVTDDHGQWILPFNTENPNLDVGTFSQLGNATRFRTINFGPGGDSGPDGDIPAAAQRTFDFADGRGWDGSVSGLNFDYDLGDGFTLRNNLNYLSGNADTLGIVPSGGAQTVNDVLSSDAAVAAGLTGIVVQDVSASAPRSLAGSSFVQTYGHWVVLKELEHFSNDLSINYNNEKHDLTVGYYVSAFSSDDQWSIGNPIVLENVANGGIALGQTADGVIDLDPALVNGGFNFNVNQAGDATVNAIYAAETFQASDSLRFDIAGRVETIDIVYAGDFGGTLDGVLDQAADISDTQFAYTAAVNYDFSDDFGAFARWSDGHRFPHFDNIREGNFNVFDVKQGEIGLKFIGDTFSFYATGYYTQTDAFNNPIGGEIPSSTFQTESLGIEIEGQIELGAFRTSVIATIQDAEITDSSIVSDIGNRILRQPVFQATIRPEYTFEFDNFSGSIFGGLQIVGDRFGDNGNTNELGSFVEVSAGAIVAHESGFFMQLAADNLFDSEGFTEADPRTPSANNARPLIGRAIRLSIGYDF